MALVNVTLEFPACGECNPLPAGRAGPRVDIVLDDEPGIASQMTFRLPDDREVGFGHDQTVLHSLCKTCPRGVLTRLSALLLALALGGCAMTPDSLHRLGATAGAKALEGLAGMLRESVTGLDGDALARTVTAGVVGAVNASVDSVCGRTLDRAERSILSATGELRGELRALAGDIRDETRRALAEALQALQVAVGGILAALGVSKAGPLIGRVAGRLAARNGQSPARVKNFTAENR